MPNGDYGLLCGQSGGQGIGAGHTCYCIRPEGHAIDSERPHGCSCGALWADKLAQLFREQPRPKPAESSMFVSHAMDEIYRLRTALSIEALKLEDLLALKTLPAQARHAIEAAIARCQRAARGDRRSHSLLNIMNDEARNKARMPHNFNAYDFEKEPKK